MLPWVKEVCSHHPSRKASELCAVCVWDGGFLEGRGREWRAATSSPSIRSHPSARLAAQSLYLHLESHPHPDLPHHHCPVRPDSDVSTHRRHTATYFDASLHIFNINNRDDHFDAVVIEHLNSARVLNLNGSDIYSEQMFQQIVHFTF